MATVDAFNLETIIRDQLKDRLAPGVCLHLADAEYWLTPLHDVVDLLRRERIDLKEFRDDVWDCDDYALVTHARMAESHFGNLKRRLPHAFGQVWGMNEGVYAHAINLMVNSDGALRFVEPQADPDKAVMTVSECDLTGIWMIKI